MLRYGVQTDGERQAVADMLTTRPDARRGTKATTEDMLREVARMLEERERNTDHIRQWVQRLRRRLGSRGCTEAEVKQALVQHRPYYLRLRSPTNDDIFGAVGKRYGVSPGAVEKAYKRTTTDSSRDTNSK